MTDIPVHLLKSLLLVAQTDSLSEAAQRLGITQPGLTKQLQLLESMLPHRVFVQEGRRKKLTAFGTELVGQIDSRLGTLDSVIRQTCERFAKPEDSTVRIIGRIGVFDQFTAKLKFPGRLVFLDSPNHEAIQAVVDQRAELGITFLQKEDTDLICQKLYEETFKLVVSKRLLPKLPENFETAFNMVKGLPAVSYKERDEIFEQIAQHSSMQYSEYRITRTIPNFRSIIAMLEEGLSWGIVPRHFPIDKSKVHAVDVPSKYHSKRQFFIYYRRELKAIPWLKTLKAEIQRQF